MSDPKEKQESPLPSAIPVPLQSTARNKTRVVFLAIWITYCLFSLARVTSQNIHVLLSGEDKDTDICPQTSPLIPDKNGVLWHTLGDTIRNNADFKQRAIDWLGSAVRVPTESYDDLGPVGEDPRWETFGVFNDYLFAAFPLVHTSLKLTKVNAYGLLYVWEGSDTSLKPVLLAAHQDVVPVNPTTIDEWSYPPYSGHFDGERLWGRGSSDDKSGLIGIMSAIESLLEMGFQPARTFVLAFGFDEESSGFQGAGRLSEALLATYGEDSFAFIIDEGGGFVEQYGSVFASPGIAEKGYLDVRIEVTSPGGHSSIPPTHTTIGVLASLLVEYEKHPYQVHLSRKDPLYSILQCFAEHADQLPSDVRKLARRSAKSKKALRELEKVVFKNPAYKSLVGTTQAIDLIQGGVKTNALPESAWAVVNHRIAVISSVSETKAHDTVLLNRLAHKFNLTYSAFGTSISEEGAPSSGTLTLSDAFDSALEPAPVTPTGPSAASYQLLSGTIKATYDAHRGLKDGNAVAIAPGMPSGNTDTRYYWKLSPHIFRYNHHNAGNATNMLSGVHTVNESIDMGAFLEMIQFFVTLILNADEAQSL